MFKSFFINSVAFFVFAISPICFAQVSETELSAFRTEVAYKQQLFQALDENAERMAQHSRNSTTLRREMAAEYSRRMVKVGVEGDVISIGKNDEILLFRVKNIDQLSAVYIGTVLKNPYALNQYRGFGFEQAGLLMGSGEVTEDSLVPFSLTNAYQKADGVK